MNFNDNKKDKNEIDLMRVAGEIVALVLNKIEENISPGITTLELDKIARKPSEQRGNTFL